MKPAISKAVTLVLLIGFFLGLLVFLYPAISQYWNSKVQSRVVADYQKMMQSMSAEDFSAYFEEAYAYNEALAALDYPLTEYPAVEGYDDILNLTGNGVIGYISIEKLQIDLPVYHGISPEVLNVAAGHMKGSSLPVGGEGTHAVLSAHRGLPSAKLFTDLDKMQVGDTFTITVLGEILTYEVDQVKIVLPNDASDLLIEPDKDYVTLLTCTPYGINTHRLLVRGHRIETIEQKVIYVTSEAYIVDRVIVTPAVALPILFVLILYVIFAPPKPPEPEEEIL